MAFNMADASARTRRGTMGQRGQKGGGGLRFLEVVHVQKSRSQFDAVLDDVLLLLDDLVLLWVVGLRGGHAGRHGGVQ